MLETLFGKNPVIPVNNSKFYKSQGPSTTQVTNLNAQFLNSHGQEALLKLEQTLRYNYGKLRENSYLQEIISLMLIFLDEESAYDILSTMLENSCKMTEYR